MSQELGHVKVLHPLGITLFYSFFSFRTYTPINFKLTVHVQLYTCWKRAFVYDVPYTTCSSINMVFVYIIRLQPKIIRVNRMRKNKKNNVKLTVGVCTM